MIPEMFKTGKNQGYSREQGNSGEKPAKRVMPYALLTNLCVSFLVMALLAVSFHG